MNEPAPAPTPPCMRVRTRRFRSDDQDSVPIARCDRTATSLKSHASHRILQAIRSPIRGHHGNLRTGGRTSAHRFSPSPTSSLPVSSFTRAFRPPARRAGIMASADFPRHFLLGISPDKNANCSCATSTFTSGPEPWALVRCATLPGPSASYAAPVRRLTVLNSGLPLPSVVAACGSLLPFGLRLSTVRYLSAVAFV
jgi:hypothetical protein